MHWDRNVIAAFCRSRAFTYISLEAIQAALDAGDADAVEAAFATYLDENYSRPDRHGVLTRAYRELFWSNSAQVNAVVEHWVALKPQSAFALAARGMHLLEAASSARGGNFARETPAENFATMGSLAARAEADLREAARLEPKLTSTYDAMIFVGRLSGNRELVNFALKAASKADPTDERFYLDWMAVSEPRWGGSLQAMAAVAAEAEKLVPKNPLMKLPVEKQRAYYGDMAMQNDNYAKALQSYEEALDYAPSPADLADAANAAGELGQYQKAVWYYSEAIRFDAIGAAENLRGRAWAFGKLGRADLAQDDLRAAAAVSGEDTDGLRERGSAFAAVRRNTEAEKAFLDALKLNPSDEGTLQSIAELYLWNMKQRDKARPYVAKLEELYPKGARTWDLGAQLADGVDDAKQAYALKRYLVEVDENDPNERQCIARSQEKLAALQKKLLAQPLQ